jgi:hypothetical protein
MYMHKDCKIEKSKKSIKNPNPNTYFYIRDRLTFYII